MGLALENSVQTGVCLTEPPSRIVGQGPWHCEGRAASEDASVRPASETWANQRSDRPWRAVCQRRGATGATSAV
jgi:hypothetical protein